MRALRVGFIVLIACIVKPVLANNEWLPSYKQIENIEKNITMPKGALKLSEYTRYYSGQSTKTEKFIIGRFILKGKNDMGIHIVPQLELPKVLDGGCKIINFKFNVENKKIVSIFCNGAA